MSAAADLEGLAAHVQRHAAAALVELDPGGYGPRLWLGYRRKKEIARALRSIRDEARLIASTSMEIAASKATR